MVKNHKLYFIKKLNGGIICSLSLSFLLFIYAPLEIYLTNQNDFWFDFYTLAPFLMRTFLIFSFICIVTLVGLLFIKIPLYEVVVSILFAILIASYIQGTFLSSGLPPLDGREIDWLSYQTENRISWILWGALCIISVVFLIKLKFPVFNKIVVAVSAFLSALLGISLFALLIQNKGLYGKNTEIATTKNQFEMSADKNFIILLFDAVDASMFSSLLEENPEYKTVFQDFTYYDNAVCAYPYTMVSIPFIWLGEWYENESPFDQYLSKATNDSPLFHMLEKQGFKMGIYDALFNFDNHDKRFDNITSYPAKVTSEFEFICSLVQLSGIKYAPFALKQACYDAPAKINRLKAPAQESENPYFNWENTAFHADIQNIPMTLIDEKVFKFIHVEGAHVPYRYNKNVELIETGTYSQNVEACITMASAYLEKLKQNNVYDNSIIIIMADHGYAEGDIPEGRQNPFFLAKGLNETHELTVNHAPISYADLQDAYSKLLSGNSGSHLFDYQEGEQRERRFLFYIYLKDAHMEEYIQHGEANDLTTLTPTGRIFDRE